MRCAPSRYSAACTDGTTCTTPSNPHCDGNRVVACDESALFGQSQDCSATGGTCTPISFGPFGDSATIEGACTTLANGSVECVPQATECDAATVDTCDGKLFVTCGTNRKLLRVDCTTLGFHACGDVGGRVGCV